ncbi:hypothetical protein DFQ15_104120 [Xylophilus ampelinus]|uniref:Uncharacterized protein n=1 Tax=Xylophilus ampelinus TaxID=54067 RepID=A0A318SIV8_9BURK|nr:hypothetical protein DFQ15_104120 [Xylophilus ampelinus]
MPYAGSQVARGGRLCILGNQDNKETPFAVTSFGGVLLTCVIRLHTNAG